MYVYMCYLYVIIFTAEYRCPLSSEATVWLPRAGVTGGYETPDMSVGN